MRLMIVAALIAPALAACSAEPRWTLWEIKAGEAIKRESGLERLVCETLRDRAERDKRAADALLAQLRREVISHGLQPERMTVGSRYRCRPDGETY
jgi:hypothetical protein